MNKVIETKAPGKLYLAGEYAVVWNKSAILVAIDKYIRIKLTESDSFYINTNYYNNELTLLDLNDTNPNFVYITKSIKWFMKYLSELSIKLKYCKIEITSEHRNDKGQKFGFGSSAAVTIAFLEALFKLHDLDYDAITLYKAGVMIELGVSNSTSFGDLATICYGKTIYYKKFDSNIIESFNTQPISKTLNSTWPGLVINEIDLNIEFLIVYTNKSSNSHSQVSKISIYSKTMEFERFLNQSEKLVEEIINKEDSLKNIIARVDDNLRYLEEITKTRLYIDEMNDIKEIVKKYNGTMKLSGSGAGDCVICFFDTHDQMLTARENLENRGYPALIYPLEEENE